MITSLFNFVKNNFAIVFFSIFLAVYYPQISEKAKFYFQAGEEPADIEDYDDPDSVPSLTLFTEEELEKFDGEKSPEIYLSILGKVYDVTKGKKHYGKGGTYHFFAGRDASAAFVTGEFENFTPDSSDVLKLQPKDLLELDHWTDFYENQYILKGFLIGRFYNKDGEKTEYYSKIDKLIEEEEQKKVNEDKLKEAYPPCNIQWKAESGTKVWCTKDSSGTARDWIGVPRKFFAPGERSFRCACIKKENLDDKYLQEYDHCDPNSDTCFYEVT